MSNFIVNKVSWNILIIKIEHCKLSDIIKFFSCPIIKLLKYINQMSYFLLLNTYLNITYIIA